MASVHILMGDKGDKGDKLEEDIKLILVLKNEFIIGDL